MFRDTVESSVTPGYVFEELRGVYHTAEHPLISKGLLASSKVRQPISTCSYDMPKDSLTKRNCPYRRAGLVEHPPGEKEHPKYKLSSDCGVLM